MKACGLVVEYNPFHNGHLYHVTEAKKISNASCMIAVMSGSFLQRGEPAIIDKFHRTRAALAAGVDIVVELPYAYAVQSSHFFAKGAIHTLNALKTSSVCFGSESGEINEFYDAVSLINQNKILYDTTIQSFLKEGLAYPIASSHAYEKIGLKQIDLVKPNNILGFSYTKIIVNDQLPMEALTIKRISNEFHDEKIENTIASATSIRRELDGRNLSTKVSQALPSYSEKQLVNYKNKATTWHQWETYFPYLHYRVMTMSKEELASIHGVDEGLEGRIKLTAKNAQSFSEWINALSTKRYTRVRLQRMFVHILTNTTKIEVERFFNLPKLPYIRLLGMSETGQAYLNQHKKSIDVPLISNLNKRHHAIELDEKALMAYYAILPAENRNNLRKQEFQLPIRK